jgi:hypothetical protein
VSVAALKFETRRSVMRTVQKFVFFTLVALFIALSPKDAEAVSLKNFRELAAFYSAATGIPLSDPKVAAAYQNAKSRLPKAGTVDEFSSPAVLGAIELSGVFCTQFITAEAAAPAANRRAHQQIDFTKAPNALADADVMSAVHAYAKLFWLRDVRADEDTLLQTTVTHMKAASTNNPAGTKQMFLAMCTQVATSIDALVNR